MVGVDYSGSMCGCHSDLYLFGRSCLYYEISEEMENEKQSIVPTWPLSCKCLK